jgi:nucleoside-diphosphate-sugar epimerase
MNSALITGSEGFIGRHLVDKLAKEKIKIIRFSRQTGKDVSNKTDWDKLPITDTVFHLAAVSGYKDCLENTNLAYQVNVSGTVNALEHCRCTKAKLIFPSTYVYDQPYEEIKRETDSCRPSTHYAFTKWLGEELCHFYTRVFKVNTLILRTSNVFGSGQEDKYLVPLIFNNILQSRKFTLTKPEIERSFVYIDDLVEAYIGLAKTKTMPGEIYNIGPEKSTTLEQLIQIMEKITAKPAKVSWSGQERPSEINLNRINIRKMQAILHWYPKTSLESGLKKMLAKP